MFKSFTSSLQRSTNIITNNAPTHPISFSTSNTNHNRKKRQYSQDRIVASSTLRAAHPYYY